MTHSKSRVKVNNFLPLFISLNGDEVPYKIVPRTSEDLHGVGRLPLIPLSRAPPVRLGTGVSVENPRNDPLWPTRILLRYPLLIFLLVSRTFYFYY